MIRKVVPNNSIWNDFFNVTFAIIATADKEGYNSIRVKSLQSVVHVILTFQG